MNLEVIAGLWFVANTLLLNCALALLTTVVFDMLEFCRELELSGPEWGHP